MVQVNWDEIDEAGSGFELLPDGTYQVQVMEVVPRDTMSGILQWNLRMAILEGDFQDRLVFDSLFFSPKALPRVKLVFSRMGLPTEGATDLEPGDLVGRTCMVTVTTDHWIDDSGKKIPKNKVPYDGYQRIQEEVKTAEDDPLPF